MTGDVLLHLNGNTGSCIFVVKKPIWLGALRVAGSRTVGGTPALGCQEWGKLRTHPLPWVVALGRGWSSYCHGCKRGGGGVPSNASERFRSNASCCVINLSSSVIFFPWEKDWSGDFLFVPCPNLAEEEQEQREGPSPWTVQGNIQGF